MTLVGPHKETYYFEAVISVGLHTQAGKAVAHFCPSHDGAGHRMSGLLGNTWDLLRRHFPGEDSAGFAASEHVDALLALDREQQPAP